MTCMRDFQGRCDSPGPHKKESIRLDHALHFFLNSMQVLHRRLAPAACHRAIGLSARLGHDFRDPHCPWLRLLSESPKVRACPGAQRLLDAFQDEATTAHADSLLGKG